MFLFLAAKPEFGSEMAFGAEITRSQSTRDSLQCIDAFAFTPSPHCSS